ncbi:hypothetical protein EMCRGX_G016571 [Ephydatia muelleri]
MAKKHKEWLVRWKGSIASHEDTLEHLSGCEQYIARFEKEHDRKQAEDDDARGQKRKKRDDDEETDPSDGLQDVRQRRSKLKQQGVKPSIVAEVWSDSSISLLGTTVYYIDENWVELHEVLLGCNGFTGQRHTGRPGGHLPGTGHYTIDDITQRLVANGRTDIRRSYVHKVQETASDLASMISVFDKLPILFGTGDEEEEAAETRPPSLLDEDCKSSVLGVFVRRCTLEYKRLAFSQLMTFHSQWHQYVFPGDTSSRPSSSSRTASSPPPSPPPTPPPPPPPPPLLPHSTANGPVEEAIRRRDFVSALGHLTLPQEAARRRRGRREEDIGAEALTLSSLHGRFGHQREGAFALNEAVRMAQVKSNPLLLEHSLAWLHNLNPFAGEQAITVLNQFVKNAGDLKLPALASHGMLQLAKLEVSMSKPPAVVLRSVACSERDSGPIVGGPAPQLALKSSMLALQASACGMYGQRWLSLLYAQLQCHMMSCDTSNEEDSDQQYEAFCLCLGIVARHLADDGEYDRALVLLGAAKNHFSLLSQHMPYKLISCCIEELGLARALGVRDVAAARLHRANMATYHQHRAMYASALIAMSEGSYHAALLETQCVLEAQRSSLQRTDLCLQLEARCHLILAEVYSRQGLPVVGLPHALEGVAFCQDHHLGDIGYEMKLTLAHIQLQLGFVDQCLQLLEKLSTSLYSNGSQLLRARARFLVAQATLCKEEALTEEVVIAVVPMLAEVITSFEKVQDMDNLNKALVLQSHLQSFASERSSHIVYAADGWPCQ